MTQSLLLRRSQLGVGCLIAALCGGCQVFEKHESTPAAPVTPVAPTAEATPSSILNQGYSLLAQLLGDEKNVSKLLIIKRDRPELGKLIKEISARTGAADKELAAFAKNDPQLNLKEQPLPVMEKRARDAISKSQAKLLLSDKPKNLEVHLLLTQADALSYGSHLAGVIASTETDPSRRTFLNDLAKDLDALHQKVLAMIVANYNFPEASH